MLRYIYIHRWRKKRSGNESHGNYQEAGPNTVSPFRESGSYYNLNVSD